MAISDAHMHPTDCGAGQYYPGSDSAEILMGCTARASEWDAMSSLEDRRIVRSYGVHPWYPEEWGPEAESRLRAILSEDRNAHVGEIGLDSKRGDLKEQVAPFEVQLSMAESEDRIASIHMIGTEKDVLDILRARPHGRVILHSYGSDSYAKPFAEEGCFFSISPRILSRSEVRVRRLLEALPADRILIETDAPNTGRGFEGLQAFADRLSSISGMDGIADAATANLRRLLDGRHGGAHQADPRPGGAGQAARDPRDPCGLRRRRRLCPGGNGPRRHWPHQGR